MAATARHKITLAEMRASDVCGLLVYRRNPLDRDQRHPRGADARPADEIKNYEL
jgi:hypothetical protein